MGRWEDGEIGGEGDKGTRGIITPQSTVNSQTVNTHNAQ